MVNLQTVDKIKNWKYLGKYFIPNKVFGKITNKFRCPNCRNDLLIYHRGKTYKIICPKCKYNRIDNKILKDDIKEEDLFTILKIIN